LVDNHKDTKNNPIKQLKILTANILHVIYSKFKQPLRVERKAFILALKDSAEALVDLLSKKLRIVL